MSDGALFPLIAALSIVLWIWMVVDVRSRRELTSQRKAVWIVAALLFPVGATLVYLLSGRRRARP